MPRPRKPDANDNVSALERGFKVLDCVAAARKPLGNGEIASLTGIPQATVSRLVATLVALGHVRATPGVDKYELAAGVVRLADAFLSSIDLRAWARPRLLALAEATGASAFLAVRDGQDMLVVEAARSRSAVLVMGADVGTRMSIATSALGRAWLSGADPSMRDAIVASWRKTSARQPGIASAGPIAALDRAREQGHALSIGEWHPSINAAGVPIRTATGEVIAMNCGGPSLVVSADRLQEEVLPLLVATAQALARDIGGIAGQALTAPMNENPQGHAALRPPPEGDEQSGRATFPHKPSATMPTTTTTNASKKKSRPSKTGA